METMTSRSGFVYYGEREGWLIVAVQAPDWGDVLQRSNFRAMAERLTETPDAGESVAIEFTGGAVGSIDYLLVRPGTPQAELAEAMLARLRDYPVFDEDDLSDLEWAEEWCVRCDSATREQHPIARCGKFRSIEDAREIQYRWEHR